MQGIVKRWLPLKGYGFIDPDDGKRDIFVHTCDVEGIYDLDEGERVKFDVEETEKGLRAVKVELIN